MSFSNPLGKQVLGKYRVLFELAEGGTARVLLAVAQGPAGFNRLVVLKVLKSTLAKDAELQRMFLEEARVSAQLHHTNVVQVQEVMEDSPPVLVMEYLDGVSLHDLLLMVPREEVPLDLQLRIISEVLSGLEYSHELTDYEGTPVGLVHRDMTPHNVFCTYDGQVKVLDFGIAKIQTSSVETETGVIKGKMRYMPPEQIAGENVDRRADIYAVGAMLWEAATGDKLWRGLSEATVMQRVLSGEFPEMKGEFPERLEAICRKAMAFEPGDRYATAVELQRDVDQVLESRGARIPNRAIGAFLSSKLSKEQAERKRAVEQALTEIKREGSLTGATTTASIRKRSQRRAGLVVLAGVLLLALGGGGLWLRSRQAEADTPAPSSSLPPPAKKPVSVRVTAFPASATIVLDGKPQPNPYSQQVEPDDALHKLLIEADGHAPESRLVRFNENIDLVIRLQEKAAPAPAPPDAGKVKPPVVRRTPPPTPAGPNCNPPYYFDKGIKKYKPGCL